MREIVCRNCGAQNPAQSKFCNKCGETLGSDTSQLCPNCESLNPLDLLYCDNCGTRLADDHLDQEEDSKTDEASAAGAQPFSLPSRPPGHTGNLDVSGEIPSWLKTGEMDDYEEGEEEIQDWFQGGQPQQPQDAGETLSLAELSGEHEPSDDLPTWLLEDDSAGEIFYSEKSTDELFSGSQDTAADGGDGEQDEADEKLTSAELESWLRAMEDDENAEEPALPEWPVDQQEQQQPLAEDTRPEPDWGAETSEDDLPTWLVDSEPEPEQGQDALLLDDEESDLPDPSQWLQSEDDEDLAPFPEPAAEDEVIPEEDFMAWLTSLDEGQTGAEGAPGPDESEAAFDFDAEEDAQISLQAEDDDMGEKTPAWLDELSEAMNEQVEAEATSSEELPEWLQTLSVQDDEQQPPNLFAADEPGADYGEIEDFQLGDSIEVDEGDEGMELPDWLAGAATELDVASTESEAHSDEQMEEQLNVEFSATSDDEVESEAIADETIETTGTDERLKTTAEGPFDFLGSAGANDEDSELVASEDLPDWFSDVLANIEGGEEAFDLGAEPDTIPDDLANVPPQLASNDLPDWLDSPFTDLPEAEPTPLDEIPEWLLPMAPTEASMEQEPEEDLNLGEVGELESSSEWSDLLEALPPPERESEALSEAEIPEWLQALKPRSLRGEGDDVEITLPEESEGPLAGLRGVLAISPVVSSPRVAERSDPELTVPEQHQQVTLLRQLAREETQTTTMTRADATARTRRAGMATRLVLALLLLAAIVAGLLLPQLLPALEPVAPANLQAAQLLLDQAAGQPVIVAFDYTPAMNGVLQPQANAILEELAANSSEAILLSQSAAGATLARQAAAGVESLQSVGIGYVPGDSLGLRNLSSCIGAEALCQMVSGRALEQVTAESLQDAALIVVLTADQENLLDWIEQVESTTSLPVMAVVTPAVAPLAAPYQETGQLSALISGQETLAAAGPLVSETQALALSHWLAAALILIGALYYLVRGVQGRK